MGSLVSHTPDTMHLMILVSLAAATSAAPQIVPYEYVEIAAEPYTHEEIPAEAYVHEEPELTPESLGIIDRSKPRAAAAPIAPQQFAAPVQQQQFVPQQQFVTQQVAAPVQGVFTGTCYNNLGAGVPCSQKTIGPVQQQQFIPQQQFVPQQQLFAQPQQVAAPVARFTGTCINHLGEGVPCRQ